MSQSNAENYCVQLLDDKIVFKNLVAARDLSETKVIEVTKKTKVKAVAHSNAKGGLREIDGFAEAGRLGQEAGKSFLARFG